MGGVIGGLVVFVGSDALVLDVDVSDEDEVADAVDQVASVLGGLTVLVNNAGTFRGGALTDMSLSAWRAVIDSHFTGAFLCAKPDLTRGAAKQLAQRTDPPQDARRPLAQVC